VRTEVVAGVTTFVTMAYIIFVQPTVLRAAGMDFGAVLVATCLASGIATLMMGIFANYPIAVAPAMGHNFFFAFTVVVAGGTPWQTALGAVAIAGAVFISLFGAFAASFLAAGGVKSGGNVVVVDDLATGSAGSVNLESGSGLTKVVGSLGQVGTQKVGSGAVASSRNAPPVD